MKNIRTRFAPSPTGFVHIGSLRTALFAYLFAKKHNGKNILRIEDTDQSRLVPGAVENLLGVMQNIGITFDEGFTLQDGQAVEVGEYGPYLQSKRLDIYNKYIADLIEKHRAYYCFCSSERLDELRREQTALKKPPMYDKLCRKLSPAEVATQLEEFKKADKRPVVRQAIPEEGHTILSDLIYGEIKYENSTIDDQVLQKSDGYPTYHLAVVVDDHLMEISHVIRGEEWVPSTPKHLLLYQAFGWEAPLFAHLPLILNPNKTKLSKRQGDVSVEDFLKKGYLKEALINFVSFLGWNPKTEQELFSLEELEKHFDLTHVNKSGAVFDTVKLDWMNSQYIRAKSPSELTDQLLSYWQEAGLIKIDGSTITSTQTNKVLAREYLENIAKLEQERLKKLSEIGERTAYFFAEPIYEANLVVWKKSDSEDAKAKLSALVEILNDIPATEFSKENLENVIQSAIKENSWDVGSTLWPMRVALSGLSASPGPFEITSVLAQGLGKEAVIERLNKAIKNLK